MPVLLPDRTATWDHLPVGSTSPPGDGAAACSWQRAEPDTTTVVESRTRPGGRACRMIHNAGVDPITSSGERCEWADFRPGGREAAGTEGWYATAVYLDPAFVPPGAWGAFLQLHHQEGTGSPPLAFRVDRVFDPDKTSAGAMYVAGRDTPTGRERAWNLTPDAPIGVPVRVIFHVVWGGEPGSKTPGLFECWTCIGDRDPLDWQQWTQEHPAGGWVDTTIYGGPQPYWKGLWYSGSPLGVVLEHDGLIRRQSIGACLQWFHPTSPTPVPVPAVDVAALRDDLTAAGLAISAALNRLPKQQ